MQHLKLSNIFPLIILSFLLNGCSWLIKNEPSKIEELKFGCGKQCVTINWQNDQAEFTHKQLRQIKLAMKSTKKGKPILISACNQESKSLAIILHNYIIKHSNKKAAIVNITEPYKKTSQKCINFVKGPIKVYLPDCSTNKEYDPKDLVGYKFGCANNYNLTKMIRDPMDFFIASGTGGNQ